MTDHIPQVITKTGDQGQTSLADGTRIAKSSLRIQVIGEIDELNSLIGLVASLHPPFTIGKILIQVQYQLFAVGEELSSPGKVRITEKDIAVLEGEAIALSSKLPFLKTFILPGGTVIAAQIHVARSVCRRAERSLAALHEKEMASPDLMRYLNRLSDLLFILAREANRSAGKQDTCLK